MQSLKVEMDQGEELARFYLGFFCIMLSSTIARSMVSSPTSCACREIFCAGRTGSSYEELRAQSGLRGAQK